MFQEISNLVIGEIIKLTVSGIIGGLIGSFIGLSAFKSQRKFETRHSDLVKKRDALRDALMMLVWIHRDILVEWDDPINEEETPKAHVLNIRNKFSQWKAVFLDDIKIWRAFEDLDMLVGVGRSSFYGETKVYKKTPSEIIDSIEEIFKNKILEIEKEIK